MTNAVKLNSNNGNLDLIKQTLQQQNFQGEALIKAIETVQTTSKQVKHVFSETKKLKHEVQIMHDSIESRITLSESESYELQSLVNKQSNVLARYAINILHGSEYWGGNEYYLKKVGQIRMVLYKHLKKQFNVRKYTLILEKDYRKALLFMEHQGIPSFNPNEFRDTPTQLKLIEELNH